MEFLAQPVRLADNSTLYYESHNRSIDVLAVIDVIMYLRLRPSTTNTTVHIKLNKALDQGALFLYDDLAIKEEFRMPEDTQNEQATTGEATVGEATETKPEEVGATSEATSSEAEDEATDEDVEA